MNSAKRRRISLALRSNPNSAKNTAQLTSTTSETAKEKTTHTHTRRTSVVSTPAPSSPSAFTHLQIPQNHGKELPLRAPLQPSRGNHLPQTRPLRISHGKHQSWRRTNLLPIRTQTTISALSHNHRTRRNRLFRLRKSPGKLRHRTPPCNNRQWLENYWIHQTKLLPRRRSSAIDPINRGFDLQEELLQNQPLGNRGGKIRLLQVNPGQLENLCR
ncbi:hypothetical protein BJ741DRAFT_637051 [Chytriomyces cf. hyalinus JEL632]|nr:hypothetical protein BJ741DRAFT_637051 [Chytriomyces cf. hyalinus JEL632]